MGSDEKDLGEIEHDPEAVKIEALDCARLDSEYAKLEAERAAQAQRDAELDERERAIEQFAEECERKNRERLQAIRGRRKQRPLAEGSSKWRVNMPRNPCSIGVLAVLLVLVFFGGQSINVEQSATQSQTVHVQLAERLYASDFAVMSAEGQAAVYDAAPDSLRPSMWPQMNAAAQRISKTGAP